MKIIGLIGDYNSKVIAHQAIPQALKLAGQKLGIKINIEWLPTEEIKNNDQLKAYAGLWCTPSSPYRNMDGAITAIKFAREQKIPFLGTCGGFQHVLIEYARHVLGWSDAEHAETAPNAARLVITPLACELVEKSNVLHFTLNSKLASAYGQNQAEESYRCRYGLNPALEKELLSGDLQVAARDNSNEVRAVELTRHPFFVATLFQPERKALQGQIPAIVTAFLQACDGLRR